MQQGYQVNKKEFHSEPFYDDKHIKTKMKLYNGRINRNFLKKITNEGVRCVPILRYYQISVVKVGKKQKLPASTLRRM